MKKILTIVFICILACFLNRAFAYENGTYKVIKIIDGDTLFLDFNKDGIPQQEEKVRINGIDTFEVKPSVFLEWQMKEFNLTQSEALGLGYFGKEFAKKNLLNKYVKAEYSGNTKLCDMGRQLMSIYYDNGKNYEQEVLKVGLAIVYKKSNLAPELYKYENLAKIKVNVKKTHWLNLVLLNKKNNTYHKVNCEYGLMASNVELIQKPLLPKYKPASCCYPKPVRQQKIKRTNIIQNFKAEQLDKKIDKEKILLYFVDPVNKRKPKDNCENEICKALLTEINSAQHTIDFAIYGIGGEDKIFKALANAQKRGVIVRGIVDMNINNKNPYNDTHALMNALGSVKSDINEDKRIIEIQKIPNLPPDYIKDYPKLNFGDKRYISGAIMHNKFFIFDGNKVWTGSTNISSTCMTYNANDAILIESDKFAEFYTKEFEQMYNENKFHKSKKSVNPELIDLGNGIEVKAYFSPIDENILDDMVILINNSQNYIYVPIFYLTKKSIITALSEAKKRGVDVKIIVDAHAMHMNKYNSETQELSYTYNLLRNSGIPIKAENWGGKMHMKSMIIDDKYVVTGSMNFTTSAIELNDENQLIIKNPQNAIQYKKEFLRLWASIPDKWLYEEPLAESVNSKYSLTDGIDNDHDFKIDSESPNYPANYRKKKTKKVFQDAE